MDNAKALGDVAVPLVELLKLLEEERVCDVTTVIDRKRSALLLFSKSWRDRFNIDKGSLHQRVIHESPSWDDIVVASRASLGVIAHILISSVASKAHGTRVIATI